MPPLRTNLVSILGGISYLVGAERWIPAVTRRVICSASTSRKKIALTFDDGPHPEHTAALLAKLAAHQAPATFFLNGRNLQRHSQVAAAIVREGHEVGNHTFTHRRLPFLSDANVRTEIASADALIREVLDVRPTFFRPPYGLFTKRVLNMAASLDYQCVVGDVFPLDIACPRPDIIAQRILRRTKPGSIIILHDLLPKPCRPEESPALCALGSFIPRLHSQGYEFVTLSSLLQEQPSSSSPRRS